MSRADSHTLVSRTLHALVLMTWSVCALELPVYADHPDCVDIRENPQSHTDCEIRACTPSQQESTCSDCYYGAGAGISQTCETAPWSKNACSPVPQHARRGQHQYAFPLNLDPMVGFGPPEFPPVSREPGKSSRVLTSPETINYPAALANLPERPVHDQLVDLITGVPTVQETDFELPVGGAVFRRIRTYSQNSGGHLPATEGRYENQSIGLSNHGSMWDPNGLFWMSSESPVLLFDGNPAWNVDQKRRISFIPDAHHSISFEPQATSDGWKYVAPTWFDAQVGFSADGALDRTTGEWLPGRQPQQVYVWTDKSSVKYTFDIQYQLLNDDLHRPDPSPHVLEAKTFDSIGCFGYPFCETEEERNKPIPNASYPPDRGFGLPYLGIIRKIEDRFGNSINYTYSDVRQFTCDDEDYDRSVQMFGPTWCHRCCNECNKVGQVKAITLKNASGEVVWTMLFTHRSFGSLERANFQNGETLRFPQQIHSVHVYRGAIHIPDGDLTLPWTNFCNASTLAEIDQMRHPNIPEGWVKEVSFMYAPIRTQNTVRYEIVPFRLGSEENCPSSRLFGGATDFYLKDGQLLRRRVTTRSTDSAGAVQQKSEYTFYRYGDYPGRSRDQYLLSENRTALLEHVFDDQTIRRILANNPSLTIDSLFAVPRDSLLRTGEGNTTKIFSDLSTYSFAERHQDHSCPDWADPLGCSVQGTEDDPLDDHLAAMFEAPGLRTFQIENTQVKALIDRRAERETGGDFRFYFFRTYPEGGIGAGPKANAFPSILHYPYIIETNDHCFYDPHNLPWLCRETPMSTQRAPWDEPLWIAVVDELDPTQGQYDPLEDRGLKTRRVVEMNPGGFILRDRTWNYTSGNGAITQSVGILKFTKYDCKGRPLEKRSLGWSIANADGRGANEGLIDVLQYADSACPGDDPDRCQCTNYSPMGTAGEPIGEGVKRGTSGQVQWKYRIERHPSKPDLIARKVEFPTAVRDLQSSGNVTTYEYELENVENFGGDEPGANLRVRQKRAIFPPVARRVGERPLYKIEFERFSDKGNREWHLLGSAVNPNSINPNTDFISVRYSNFDSSGQLLQEIQDYDPATVPGSSCGIEVGHPAFPTGFNRGGPNQALNYVTSYEYDERIGESRKVYSDCTEDRRLSEQVDENTSTLYEFKGLTPAGNGGQYYALAPGKISRLEGGKVRHVSHVKFRGQAVPSIRWPYDIIQNEDPRYDGQGRVSSVSVSDANGDDSVSIEKVLFPSGEIMRNRDLDGTITRYTYDTLGRKRNTFRGSRDVHVYWGTATPPDDHCADAANHDDMYLLERRYYGEEVENAGLVSLVRSYPAQVVNQYEMSYPPDCHRQQPPPTNMDRVGRIERFGYDWRQREVWKELVDESGKSVRREIMLFDNLGKIRFEAVFSGSGPTVAIARNLSESLVTQGTAFNATALLSLPGLLALKEHRLNARGQSEEIRNFSLIGGRAQPQFVSEYQGFEHTDSSTELIQPNKPSIRNTYDGLGRNISTSMWSRGKELMRTEQTLDRRGRPRQTISYLRDVVSTDTAGPLTVDNSILSYEYNWFDDEGNNLATAKFGTNNAADIFARGPRPSIPLDEQGFAAANPVGLDSNGDVESCRHNAFGPDTVVTCTRYNKLKQAEATFNADGTVTRRKFDSFGKLLLEIENADTTIASERRAKAYKYRPGSKLIEYAALVAPEHENGNVHEPKDIKWEAKDGSLRITKVRYGAEVFDSNGARVSSAPGLIAALEYPDPITGQPSEADEVNFAYFPDGKLAARIDQRDVSVVYHYDSRGEIASVAIDDSKLYGLRGQNAWAPTARVASLVFERDSLGRVEKVKTVDAAGATTGLGQLSYDGYGNLRQEIQSPLGAAIGKDTFRTQYLWAREQTGSETNLYVQALQYPRLMASGFTANREGRVLTFKYSGAATEPSSITDSSFGTLANYRYVGFDKRVGADLGQAVRWSLGSDQLQGLDRLGRIRELDYQSVGNQRSVQAFSYDFDRMDRLDYERLVQGDPQGRELNRSLVFAYDQLGRLAASQRGVLPPGAEAIDTRSPYNAVEWNLDDAGNLSGDPDGQASLKVTGTARLDQMPQKLHFITDKSDRIGAVYKDGRKCVELQYDTAGNLVYDGKRVYQYDGMSRLVRISEVGSAVLNKHGGVESGVLGPSLETFWYDAFGRLVRRENRAGTESYLYDGFRRITELSAMPGRPNLLTTTREYLHSPTILDEVIAQVLYQNGQANSASIYYYLQNLSRNASALVDRTGKIVSQYTYLPYGVVSSHDQFDRSVTNRIGHQGLFWVGFGDKKELTAQDASDDYLGEGLYYNRYRFYSPRLERFLNRDPHGVGVLAFPPPNVSGEPIGVMAPTVDLSEHYIDGVNVFEYQRSAPYGADPSGLMAALGLVGGTSVLAGEQSGEGSRAGMVLAQAKKLLDLIRLYEKVVLQTVIITATGSTLACEFAWRAIMTCSCDEYAESVLNKEYWCSSQRACNGEASPAENTVKLGLNQACKNARILVVNRCFGGVMDTRHALEVAAVDGNIADCLRFIAKPAKQWR